MAPVGIEPKTFALLARRSNQLSYGAGWLILTLFMIWLNYTVKIGLITVKYIHNIQFNDNLVTQLK